MLLPLVPMGASIVSIIAAHEALLTLPGSALGESLMSGSKGKVLTRLGLQWQIDPRDLLLEHTIARLKLAPLEVEAAQARIAELLEEDKRGGVSRSLGNVVRRCPECAEKDLARYGFAYSRVTHQLAPVRSCYEHGLPLEEKCARCGAPFMQWMRRSSIPPRIEYCSNCGHSGGLPLDQNTSPGYHYFLRLLSATMTGDAPMVRPGVREDLLREFVADGLRSGSPPLWFFTTTWNASDFRSASEMACCEPGALSQALRGAKRTCGPFACIAAVSAAQLFARYFEQYQQLDLSGTGVDRTSGSGFSEFVVEAARGQTGKEAESIKASARQLVRELFLAGTRGPCSLQRLVPEAVRWLGEHDPGWLHSLIRLDQAALGE